MRKQMVVLTALAAVVVMMLGAVPAGAANSGQAAAILSPRLGDNFPCQSPNTSLPAFDAISKWATGTAASYAPCDGTIYSAAQGAVNGASLTASGTHGSNAFSVAGVGAFSATYTYAEPCQSVAGSPKEAATGEATGTLSVSGPASGVYGTSSVLTASTTSKFYWSRVGLTALVGLDNPTITLGTTSGTKTISGFGKGLAAAVFIPTQSPDCNNPAIPPANAIVIASPSLTFSS